MVTLNPCVKRGFITVCSLIAIVSGLLLAITLFSHGYYHEDEEIDGVLPGLQVMYAASIITVVLVSAGLYGLCKRHRWMMICVPHPDAPQTDTMISAQVDLILPTNYVIGMTLSCLLLSILNIQGMIVRPQLSAAMREHYLELMPLTNTSKRIIIGMGEIQSKLQCCGLDQGYQDWGYNISESCLCVKGSVNPCVAAPRNSSLFKNRKTLQAIMIYKEPCVSFLVAHAVFIVDVLLGVMFCMLLLWVSSVVLCVVLLFQLGRQEDPPTVIYSPEAKAGHYSVLSDDTELT